MVSPNSTALARFSGPLAWSTLSFGAKASASILSFALVARHFGADSFGIYAGTIGFVSLFTGFSSLGSAELATRALANPAGEAETAEAETAEALSGRRDEALGQLLSRTASAAPVCLLLVISLGAILLPAHGSQRQWLLLIGLLAIGEFASNGVLNAFNSFLLALDSHRAAALLSTLAAISRLAIILLLVASGTTELTLLALALAIVGIGTFIIALAAFHLGGFNPRWSMRWRTEFRSGVDLALGATARKTIHDVDQAVLLRSGFSIDAGLYGIGARISQYAFLPAMIILQITYPRYFNHGANGIRASLKYAKKVGVPLIGYGLLAGVGIIVSRSIIVPLFGESFADARPILLALCAIPLARVLHSILGDVLISSGHISSRTRPMVIAAIGNLAANLVLIPLYSWKAAVATTYATDLVVILAYTALIHHHLKAEAKLGIAGLATGKPHTPAKEQQNA